MWAAANGHVAKVAELIQQGARVNLRGRDGLTAFSVSMANGHTQIPPLLVRAGADCQTPNAGWRKELESRNPRAAELLTEFERLGTGLIEATERGDLPEMIGFLQKGAPTGFLSKDRETALMIAARRDNFAAVRALLRSGALVTDDHVDFLSALDVRLSSQMRRYLLTSKPSPGLLARGRLSAANRDLYVAIQRGDSAEAKIAFAKGADPNARWGPKPAVVLAAEKNSTALVQTLLDAGAKPIPEDTLDIHEAGTVNRDILRMLGADSDPGSRLKSALSRIVKFDSPELRESAQWLLSRANESTSGVSEDYVRQIEATARALEGSGDQKEIIEEATADLKAKADHCRKSGIWLGGKVPVAATTRRGDTAVNNWQVFYLPRIFAHAQGVEPNLIPSWTSPARQSIEPGRYHFWAVDPTTGKRSALVVQSIVGRDEVPVLIPLP